MTAQEARAIAEAVQAIPLGIRFMLREIKGAAEAGYTESISRQIKPQYKEYLEKNGYTVIETNAVFFAGNPPEKATKITW